MSDLSTALIGFVVLALLVALVFARSGRPRDDGAATRLAASDARLDEERRRVGELEEQLRSLRDQLSTMQADKAAVEARIEEARRSVTEQEKSLANAKEQLRDSFKVLAAETLADNRKELLAAGDRMLMQLSETGTAELDARRSAVEGLIRPLSEALRDYRREAEEIEKIRQQQIGTVQGQYQQLAAAASALRVETAKLVNALRSPHVRGRWGQLTLRRAAELAGMVDHCDFYEQESVPGSRLRPDMVVRLAGQRLVVVDAKVPLDGYLDAIEGSDEARREEALERHARQTRDHIKGLASKEYQQQFDQAPDFVVAFIPSDSILAAAVEKDSDLVEFALSQEVVIATPSSLFALLRVIAHGWRREQLAEHAERVRGLGGQLAERLQVFLGHVERLGAAIRKTVEVYNESVGSLESRVLPSARRFRELGVTTQVPPELERIDVAPRSVLLPVLQEGAQEIFPEDSEARAERTDPRAGGQGAIPWGVVASSATYTCTCKACGRTFEGSGPRSQYCSEHRRADPAGPDLPSVEPPEATESVDEA